MNIYGVQPYVASTIGSMILIDSVDDKIIRRVDDKHRNDHITTEYLDSVIPKTKMYLIDFLKKRHVDMEMLNSTGVQFKDFWDHQVELYRMHEAEQSKKKIGIKTYQFDVEYIEKLTSFYDAHGKSKEFNYFLDNIPNSVIKQPLNELFSLMCKIIDGRGDVITDEIRGEKLSLSIKDQLQWKMDMIKYLYSFNEIEELNKDNFYKGCLLKKESFLRTLFHLDEKGVGRGEMVISYMFSNAKVSGGSLPYDVILMNGKTYEVKEYVGNYGGIRLGTEGKLTRYDFWKNIQQVVHAAQDTYNKHDRMLFESLNSFTYDIWKYMADDEKKGDSYTKSISAGVSAGELSDANLKILKMWCYLMHEKVIKHNYCNILSKDILHKISELRYVVDPELLEKDLDMASLQYFDQHPELDAFIVFRPDKVNIVEKNGFAFKTITQAAVKFLESDLVKKSVHYAKTAFLRWKSDMDFLQTQLDLISDKSVSDESLEKLSIIESMRNLSYLDFYNMAQEEAYDRNYAEKVKKELMRVHTSWEAKRITMEKKVGKLKSIEAQERNRSKWFAENPKP